MGMAGFDLTSIIRGVDQYGNFFSGEDFAIQWNVVSGSDHVLLENDRTLSTQLNDFYRIAVDSHGRLFVADNNRIFKVDTEGKISFVAGTGTEGYSGDGGPAIDADLKITGGLHIDKNNNIYFDSSHRIRKVDSNGIITTIIGDGTFGDIVEGALASQSRVGAVESIVVDNIGNLYFTDVAYNKLRKIDSNGYITTVLLNPNLQELNGLGIDTSGALYIPDAAGNKVYKSDANGNLTAIAGTGSKGHSGDGGPAVSAQLNVPVDVKLDNDGNIYVVEAMGKIIRKIDNNGVISTVAGSGREGEKGDGGFAVNAEFRQPRYIAIDTGGNIYIADNDTNRVRKVDGNGIIQTVAGTGIKGNGGGNMLMPVSQGSGFITATINGVTSLAIPFNVKDHASIIINSNNILGIIEKTFNYKIPVEGGNPPYIWNISGLPQGLSYDAASGNITGKPKKTGEYSLTVLVTDSNNDSVTKTIDLVIAQALSIDIENIYISEGSLNPVFDKNRVAYQVDLNKNIDSLDITAQLVNSSASLKIAGKASQSNQAEKVELTQGVNLIPLVVSSPEGSTQKSYVLSVNGKVSNKDLSSLVVSEGGLNFDKNTLNYNLDLDNHIDTINISATADDSKALVLINGSVKDASTVNLDLGVNTIEIIVVAQDASTKTYTVNANRQRGDANLSSVTLDQGTLNEIFDSAVTNYTARIVNSIDSLVITPVLSDINATVTVNGKDPSNAVLLNVGENLVTIEVIGEDGVTSKNYSITITRCENLEITHDELPIGIVGALYFAELNASGGKQGYTWVAYGLPDNLVINSSTGEITGTTVSEGLHTIQIVVEDDMGSQAIKTLVLKVNLGSGNGGYIITPHLDPHYTPSLTQGGIPMVTINKSSFGFKYISVDVIPVNGHVGDEVGVLHNIELIHLLAL